MKAAPHMKVSPVRYFEFFQQVKVQKFESTRQVIDSIFRYEKLVNYRMTLQKDGGDYWFFANLVDDTLSKHSIYRRILFFGKDIEAKYLLLVLDDLETAITDNYIKQVVKPLPIVVRDTLVTIKIWQKALK